VNHSRTLNVEDAQYRVLTEEEKCRDLVGGFILAFGDIELFAHHLWQLHCPGVKATGNFRPRTIGLLKSLQRDAQKYQSLIEPLTEALGMIDNRNTG
jgi:hypothetical protein